MVKQLINILDQAMPKVSIIDIERYERIKNKEAIFKQIFLNKNLYAYYSDAIIDTQRRFGKEDAEKMSDVLLGIFHIVNSVKPIPQISLDTYKSFLSQITREKFNSFNEETRRSENPDLYRWILWNKNSLHGRAFYNLIRAQNEVNILEREN